MRLTFLHFNDVYEIAPVNDNRPGGLARVAALRQRLCEDNPHTLVTFAGDLFNPAGLGSAKVAGAPLLGRHAVAVMNWVGVDYMTFGDNELSSVKTPQFAERVAAINFRIVSSNVLAPNGEPFVYGAQAALRHDIFSVSDEAGQTLRVGIFGLTKPIRFSQVPHTYVDWREAAASAVRELRDQVDVLIALTHQPLSTDEALVERFPEIDLVLGGDDHQHIRAQKHSGAAPVYKADSNARSAWVIQLIYNFETRQLKITDHLQPVTNELPEDAATREEANRWINSGFDAFRAEGWEPTAVVAEAPVDLDGFDSSIRNHPTALTELITSGMMAAAADAELALICSWAIRLDDLIPAGSAVTTYDIIRLFYQNSPVYLVEIPGDYLQEILDFGERKAGSGSYILRSPNVTGNLAPGQEAVWQINQQPLSPNRHYRVAMGADLRSDYLLLINETRAQTVRTVGRHSSLSEALIAQLQGNRVSDGNQTDGGKEERHSDAPALA